MGSSCESDVLPRVRVHLGVEAAEEGVTYYERRPRKKRFDPRLPAGAGRAGAVAAAAVRAARRQAATDEPDDMDMGMHGDDGYHGDMEQDPVGGARVGGTLVDRAERNRRTHAAWKQRRPSDRLHAVSYFARVSHARESQQQQQVSAMQTQIEEFFVLQQQTHVCGEALGRFQNHTILYCSLEFTGGLSVPSCLCTACGVVSPPALAFGCFPNSPVEPSIWYDTSVLEFYKHLGTEEGVSATGGYCVFAGVLLCVCMCASMRACMRACVRACVCVCVLCVC
jgi:hypothetical protein